MTVLNMLEPFMPQLILILFALLVPALDYLFRDKRLLAVAALMPLVGVAAAVVAWMFLDWWTPPASSVGLVEIDLFSGLFTLVFLAVGIIVVLTSADFVRKDRNQGEYYSLILLAVTGMTMVRRLLHPPAPPRRVLRQRPKPLNWSASSMASN